MLTKKQFEILSIFHNNLFKELTFKEIKEQSKQKSNNMIQLALKKFIKENIIISKKVGDVNTYKLNLNNNLTKIYLDLINQSKLKLPILKTIENSLKIKNIFFILLLFGSYAKNQNRKSSDIDIAILIKEESQKKDIQIILETIKRRELQNIDYHIITVDEFQEMLNVDYENLGKQIYKNNVIYYGYQNYLELLKWMTKQNYIFNEQRMN